MNDLVKNKIFEAEITGYSSEGAGVCRIGGRAVFVPGTIVGEKWMVKILKVTNTAVYGRAHEAILLSPEREKPACPYYVRCGGCVLQHMSYAEEKRFKLAKLNDALKHIGHQSVMAEEIIGADSINRYRNKGIYTVRQGENGPVSGFFAPRSHEVVPIDACLIQTELADRACAAVLEFIRKNKIPAYDEKSGRGTVRHVFVRGAVHGADVVATVISARGFGDKTESLVSALREKCPELTGVVLNINKSRGNTVLAGDFYTLWGSEIICDSLGGISYEISPQSFYQINPAQAEKLYDRAMEYADAKGETALDMYCGAGTISLYLAKSADRVIGAEIVPEAIENAKKNAELNGVKNAEFICADASEAAEKFLRSGIKPGVIVVDPPRKGMAEAAVRALCSMEPKRIVYVSCNPATLARDLCVYNSCGYELKKATAVDMFPRTHHVEAVVLLSRA